MKKPDINKLREAITKLILEAGDQYSEILGTGITSIEGEDKLTIHYDDINHLEDYSVEIEIKEPRYNSVWTENE